MSASPSAPPRRRGRVLLPAALVLVTVAAGGGAATLLGTTAAASTEDGVVTATRGSLAVGIAATGTVRSRTAVPLAFSVDGAVSRVLLGPGATVGAGDLVATLDDTVARTRLTAAQDRLDADTAARDALRAAPPVPVVPVVPVAPAVPGAPAVPETTTTPIGSTAVSLSRLEGAVADDTTALAEARAALAATELRAPRAGTITTLTATPGAPVAVARSGGVVGAVADLGDLSLTLDVAPGDVARVRPGQRADAAVDGVGERVAARVAAVAPTPDAAGTYAVTLGLEAPPATLRVGQRAVGRVVVGEAEGALLVPRRAVVGRSGAETVTVRTPAGDRRVPVGVGLTDADTVQITQGLADGAAVVVPASSGGTP